MLERHYLGAELPPARLRGHVGVNEASLNFWQKRITSSRWVLDVFGTNPDAPILDWGCGSGRTLVWLRCHPVWREQYHGCDVDREAIDWLRSQGEEHVDVCDDFPPLPYPDSYFGGMFAFSVVTHIPADRHRSWYRELHRVLAPGGRVLFTTHGAWEANHSPPFVQEQFAREEQAFWACPAPEHYKDSSIVSEVFTRRALEGLVEIERFTEEGYGGQDAVIARRSSGTT